MKTHCLALVTVALLGLTAITFAESPQQSLRLGVKLSDGSYLVGTPDDMSLPVHTPYGKMDIPLTQILRIKLGDDQEKATVYAINGDKITGVMGSRKIRLRTLFGDVSVGTAHIKGITITDTGRLPVHAKEKFPVVARSGGQDPFRTEADAYGEGIRDDD